MAHADVMLFNSLMVMMKDPHIATHIDPKAAAQAREAIRTFCEENNTPNTLPVTMDEWVCAAPAEAAAKPVPDRITS